MSLELLAFSRCCKAITGVVCVEFSVERDIYPQTDRSISQIPHVNLPTFSNFMRLPITDDTVARIYIHDRVLVQRATNGEIRYAIAASHP